MACRKLNRVTETKHMGKSNVINLKPISQILFLKQVNENQELLVLQPDSWRGRPRSTSTPHRGKVSNTFFNLLRAFLNQNSLLKWHENALFSSLGKFNVSVDMFLHFSFSVLIWYVIHC